VPGVDSTLCSDADREAVLRRMQYWRLITHQLTFHQCVASQPRQSTPHSSNPQLSASGSGLAVSFGLYLLFQFRVLERQVRHLFPSARWAATDDRLTHRVLLYSVACVLPSPAGLAQVRQPSGLCLRVCRRVAARGTSVGAGSRARTSRRPVRADRRARRVLQPYVALLVAVQAVDRSLLPLSLTRSWWPQGSSPSCSRGR
jgi:hypothetical protein